MRRRWYRAVFPCSAARRWLLLAAVCLASALPLQAGGLGSLNRADILGGKLSFFRLPGVNGLIVKDSAHPETSLVALRPQDSPDAPQVDDLGQHFIDSFGLHDYEAVEARDGSGLIFLVSSAGGSVADGSEAAAMALADRAELMRAVNWLNTALDDAPYSMRQGRLVWRKRAAVFKGAKETEVEVALDLARGLPCVVELQVAKAGGSGEEAGFSRLLGMEFEPLPKKQRNFRKDVGGKVLARQGNLFLLQTAKDSYRIGSRKALKAAHSGTRETFKQPQVAGNTWPQPQGSSAGAGQAGDASQAGKGAQEPPPAPTGMPTPAEARGMFSNRLKSI